MSESESILLSDTSNASPFPVQCNPQGPHAMHIPHLKTPFKARATRVFAHAVTNGWYAELLSLFLSSTLLCIMIYILAVWNGQNLIFWSAYYPITPNAFISVLAVSSKACLFLPITSAIGQARWIYFRDQHSLIDFQTLDSGSRGPWGYLQVLFRIRSVLAVSTAVVALLSLAFEPFSQQSMSLISPPNIPILSSMITGQFQIGFALNTASTNVGLYSAAISSLIDYMNGGVSDLPPTTTRIQSNNPRPSYQDYASLSLYPLCQNKTEQVTSNCTQDGQTCTLSLPNGLQLTRGLQSIVSASTTIPEDQLLSIETALAYINIIRDAVEIDTTTNVPHCAVSCQIFLGAEHFQLVTMSGMIVEIPMEVYNITHATNTSTGGTLFTIDVPLNLSAPYPATPGQFQVDLKSVQYFREYLASMFNASLPIESTLPSSFFQEDPRTSLWSILARPSAFITDNPEYLGTDSVENLNNFPLDDLVNDPVEDLINGIGQLTQGMTTWLRDNTGVNALHDNGLFNEIPYWISPYLQVRWAWIALPIALEVLTLALLLTIMALTTKLRIPVWKSSTVATLFHGIDQAEFPDATSTEAVSVMEKIAARKKVKLIVTPTGPRLIGDVTNV